MIPVIWLTDTKRRSVSGEMVSRWSYYQTKKPQSFIRSCEPRNAYPDFSLRDSRGKRNALKKDRKTWSRKRLRKDDEYSKQRCEDKREMTCDRNRVEVEV